MNRYGPQPGLQELERQIRRYFDAETSLAEERDLRRALAATTLSSPDIDEAKAVMGLFAASRARTRKKRKFTAVTRIAAAVAALTVSSAIAYLLFTQGPQPYEYIAFHNGVEINDPETVTELMNSQLQIIMDEHDVPEKEAIGQLNDIMEIIQSD